MRRVRPWVVAAGCFLALGVAVTVIAWRQGDFWRESVAHYLRARLADDFGAQFQTGELRGRWFPPGLSLGRVTFQRNGEPWVLTADDVRISFNLYAVLSGRERLGRVVIDRPRLFLREREPAAGTAPAAPGQPAPTPPVGVGEIAQTLASLVKPPFPLRVLDIRDGRVEYLDRAGGRFVAAGVRLTILVSSGSARADVQVADLRLEGGGRPLNFGRLDAEVVLEAGRATVRELVASGGPLTGKLRGTVGYGGEIALQGDLAGHLDQVAALFGSVGTVGGTALFSGAVDGRWPETQAEGSITLRDPVWRGRKWPEARGLFHWSPGRLSWSALQMRVGEGALSLSGEVDFPGATPRYRLDLRAGGIDPARLPSVPVSIASRVVELGGVVTWEGSGFGSAASGAGRLEARIVPASRPGEEIALEAGAALAGGRLDLQSFHASTRTIEIDGSGSWSPGSGFSGKARGTVGDLGSLAAAPGLALGGRGSFEGEGGLDAAGPRFKGVVRFEQAKLGQVGQIAGSVGVVLDAERARLTDGLISWPGGRGTASGSIALPSGPLEVTADLQELSLAESARQLGVGPGLVAGTLQARLRLRGSLSDPKLFGQVAGTGLSYRRFAADTATMNFTLTRNLLGITEMLFRRGTSTLSFRGNLRPGRTIDGTFESASFDLNELLPDLGLDLAGTLRGRLQGSLRAPQLEGVLQARRLNYRGLDLKGGEIAVDYRDGKAAVQGWVTSAENRLRAVIEPNARWRFESDLDLRQFAPEIFRTGFLALPPAIGRTLGRASFLAAGRLKARGRLAEPASISAEVRLETLWLQAGGKSLQNRAPVLLSWGEAGLTVGDLRLAGDQYHVELSGTGSPATGWRLKAAGALNLSLFKEYWPELEEVDGLGDLQLSINGPWSAPLPEGSITVHGAYVKVRPLPEPLERLEGRLELHGRTLTATSLTGSIGDGEFRGRGTYSFAEDRLDAQVDGLLDLSLFRRRLTVARDVRGPVEVRLRLAGPLSAPTFSGDVEVLDAELFARPFPAKIAHVRGKVAVGAERLEVLELSGETGGGTVRLSGTLDWGNLPARVDAQLEGRGILVSLGGSLKAQGDLNLGLHGDYPNLKLAGEVRILKARYPREFDERPPALLPAAAGAEPGGGTDLSRVTLDVKVRATDNVWITNRMAKIEAAVALDLGGALGAPVVSGEITAIQGEAFYLSRRFRLESGSLRFVPPETVPRLDLQASTTVGEIQILFLMDGPLDRLSYHLTSLPGMSQGDLVALLAIGETRSGLEKQGERASTVGAAVFTSEPLVNALGNEARSAMGLEVLQLEPIVGLNNQVSARLTVGTHLSDRVFVSYSQNLGATEDQQVVVQYYLLDYLSLWGQELRQGIYGLDLVFRHEFR